MTTYACDRCGKEVSQVNLYRVSITHTIPSELRPVYELRSELCTECTHKIGKEIYEFVKENKNDEEE